MFYTRSTQGKLSLTVYNNLRRIINNKKMKFEELRKMCHIHIVCIY